MNTQSHLYKKVLTPVLCIALLASQFPLRVDAYTNQVGHIKVNTTTTRFVQPVPHHWLAMVEKMRDLSTFLVPESDLPERNWLLDDSNAPELLLHSTGAAAGDVEASEGDGWSYIWATAAVAVAAAAAVSAVVAATHTNAPAAYALSAAALASAALANDTFERAAEEEEQEAVTKAAEAARDAEDAQKVAEMAQGVAEATRAGVDRAVDRTDQEAAQRNLELAVEAADRAEEMAQEAEAAYQRAQATADEATTATDVTDLVERARQAKELADQAADDANLQKWFAQDRAEEITLSAVNATNGLEATVAETAELLETQGQEALLAKMEAATGTDPEAVEALANAADEYVNDASIAYRREKVMRQFVQMKRKMMLSFELDAPVVAAAL